MEQQQVQPPEKTSPEPLMLWYVVIAVSVAAILVFSALAAFYYTQAADHRDSKYRTQFQIVSDMKTFIPVGNATIGTMLDAAEDNGMRRASALSATRIAEMLSGDAFSLAVMYDEDDERRTTFFALGTAFSGVAIVLFDGYEALSSPSHVFSDDYVLMIETATGIMTAILGYLQQGLLSGVNGISDPYDVVGGMPLDSIASAASALDETVSLRYPGP
ncbi:MAG: hypothetical protein JW880_06920 [Candidatus Thermoplasmatota archaeon]|nr:hypothetical protein [Candidatus Thermoplasmatota archaeon]